MVVVINNSVQTVKKDVPDVSTKRPDDEGVVSFNANAVLMLHIRLKIIQERDSQVNNTTLESGLMRLL